MGTIKHTPEALPWLRNLLRRIFPGRTQDDLPIHNPNAWIRGRLQAPNTKI